MGFLPIVLCFSEPVKGISSSSVKVKSSMISAEQLTWKPLSITNSIFSSSWVAYVRISDENSCNSQSHSVEVILACSEEVLSKSGSACHHPFTIKFTIDLSHSSHEVNNRFENPIKWDCYSKPSVEAPKTISLCQLQIDGDVDEDSNMQLKIIADEINLFKDIPDDNSKFVKLTLSRLIRAYAAIKCCGNVLSKKAYYEEALQLLDDLIKIDPAHQRYYEDERSIVYLDQVTSEIDRMSKLCFVRDEENESISFPHDCLQLSRSSLTRIGPVDHLLWVQMLDLSHNKLRSVAGLESLQQLIGLNISYNQISSFTALEPLKKVISLRVLDVSFNEIGAHSVDTTRYLCTSPLSHSAEEILELCRKENIDVAAHNWEAILLFKSLRLEQLDIDGNAIAFEDFKRAVLKAMPSLKWLNGEGVH